jgi:hypothetical protein
VDANHRTIVLLDLLLAEGEPGCKNGIEMTFETHSIEDTSCTLEVVEQRRKKIGREQRDVAYSNDRDESAAATHKSHEREENDEPENHGRDERSPLRRFNHLEKASLTGSSIPSEQHAIGIAEKQSPTRPRD